MSSSYTVEAVLKATGADQFTRAFQNASKAADRMHAVGGKMKSVGRGLTMGLTVPIVGMGVAVVKTGAQFDDQMSTVGAVSGATGKQMDQLREQAKDMGMNTRYSASEASEGMEMLARAGFSTTDVMSALPHVLDLAAAGNVELGDAADITSNILSGFGMEASETAKVADVLAKASADSNVDVQSLGEAFKHVGPVASTLGLSIEDTAASIGVLGDAGIAGGQAGNMLKRGLLNLSSPTEQQTKLMDELNMEMFDANGQMKTMPEVIGELEDGMHGMTDQQKISTMETLFGSQAVAGFAALVDEGSENLGDFSGELENSQGTAAEMHEEMEDNLMGSFRSLMSALEGLSLAFYEMGDGAIRSFVDWLTELVKRFIETDDETKQLILAIAGIAAAIGPVLIVVGTLIQSIARLASVFTFLTSPIGIAILAITAIAAIIVYLWNTNEEFRASMIEIWDSVQEIISLAATIAGQVLSVLGQVVMILLQVMIPIIEVAMNIAAAFFVWIAKTIEANQWIIELIGVVAIIVAGIAIFITVVMAIAKAVTIAVAIFKIFAVIIAFLTSPIGLVILAITALVAIVIWLGEKFEWIGDLLDKVSGWMTDAWNGFLGFFGLGTKEASEEASESIESVSDKGKEDLDSLATEGTASAEELNDGVTSNVDNMATESGDLMAQLESDGKIDMDQLNMGATDATGDMSGNVLDNIGDMSDGGADMFADLEDSGQIDMSNLNVGATNEAGDMSDDVLSQIGDMSDGGGDLFSELESSGQIDMSNLNTGVTKETNDMSSNVKSDVADMESSASGDFSGLTKDMSDNASKVKESVSKSFNGMGQDINKEMNGIMMSSEGALAGVADNFESGMKSVRDTVSKSMRSLSTTVKLGMNNVSRGVKTGFNKTTRTTTMQTAKMTRTVTTSMTRITNAYRVGFSAINSAVSSGMSRVLNTVRSTNQMIVASTRTLNSQMYSAGKHAMSGLNSGLIHGRGAALSTARSTANRISSTMKKALKVRSPSRVMMEIGEFVGQGLVVGIQSMRSAVDRAAEQLGLSAIPELEPIDIGAQVSRANAKANKHMNNHLTTELNVSTKEPAYINVAIGNQQFDGFVEDITEVQSRKTTRLDRFRG